MKLHEAIATNGREVNKFEVNQNQGCFMESGFRIYDVDPLVEYTLRSRTSGNTSLCPNLLNLCTYLVLLYIWKKGKLVNGRK